MYIIFDGESVSKAYEELEKKEKEEKEGNGAQAQAQEIFVDESEIVNEIIEESEEQTQIKGQNYNEKEKVKIIKEDPVAYRYYINFLKREKPKITHLSSSFSYLPIFHYIKNSCNKERKEEIIYKNEIYIGKPHGFYSIHFGFLDYRNAVKGFKDSIYFFEDINEYKNGVLNKDNISSYHWVSQEMWDFIHNIKYAAETLGSTLSVAQGSAIVNTNQKYVIMSDAEIETGEFFENLLLQKKFNFKITLLIDYNGWSKQNKTITDINDLKTLLEIYNQPAIIFDTRGFREYLEDKK